MSKTILANVDGFTPVIDSVVQDVGAVTALVFGKVWRYCQMADGICKASQERIADELGMSRATINTHFAKLCNAGYLRDTTPNLLGKPHEYADTGKAGLSISLTANQSQPVKNFDTTCQNFIQPPVKKFDTKKVNKIQKETERYDTIGAKIDECKIKLNPNSAFIVKAWREWFSDEIICRALELGAGKSINYTDRILCGWHENGVPETNQQKAKGEKRNDRINPKVDQKPISDDDKIALIAAIKAQRQREAASV